MRLLFSCVVLAFLAGGAWLTYGHWPDPQRTTSASNDSVVQTSSAAAPMTSSAPSPAPSTQPSGQADAAPPPPAVATQTTQRNAEKFVAILTETEAKPLTVERADHFVTGDQMLALIPSSDVQKTTINALSKDPSLTPDSPITVVRDVEQVERITPEKLIAQSAGNLDAPIQVLQNNQVRESTVRQVLQRASRSPDAPIDVITHTQYFEQTTPRELAQSEAEDTSASIQIIRKRHSVEASSIAELMRTHEVKSGSLFYVRTVREGDDQGIWGIVHDGIIDNFARGMAIRRGKEINRYQVDIPTKADERRADSSSSYLGRLIFNKSKESHVYNFKSNRMGQNPDRIFPGQEIVIIDFQAEELIQIYKHFVAQRG
jgi:hypothetical protein